ncbi:MAG: pilin [bacterium]
MRKNIFNGLKKLAVFFIFFILLAHIFAYSPAFKEGGWGIFSPQYARAEDVETGAMGANYTEIVPKLSVPVGKFDTNSFDKANRQNWLGQYILAWFNYLVGAIGIIAVMMISWGGIKWITSGGNSSQVEDAKGKIKNAVMGIVLLLCTYTIFKTINPRLLNLSLPEIDRVAPIEYCCRNKTNTSILKIKYDEECDDTTETTLILDDCKKSGEAMKAGCPSGTTGTYIYKNNQGIPIRMKVSDQAATSLGIMGCKELNKELAEVKQVFVTGGWSICYTCRD